ncbi:TPA: ead/Ea22-like family protein [Klebsiella pneumoniae]|nr:ead/Ea22-like family protein [Klebsiella pneumoniae]
MTDITALAQSLKNAASKALIEEGLTWFSEEQLSHEDGIALHKADAEFIALANPANVLALVEALEKSEKTSEARREAIDRTHNMFVRERDRANAAEEALEKAQATEAHCNRGWIEAHEQEERAEAAEHHIAELESRTVKLPDEVDVLLNHLEEVLPSEAFQLIDVHKWNAVSRLSATGIKVEAE